MAKKTSPSKTTATEDGGDKPRRAPADATLLRQVLDAGEGLLRLAPTWVPRSFLMPGRRIKLAPQDVYALGAHRGGIDERWFGSPTGAGNEGRVHDEGLSYVAFGGQRFTLRDAVSEGGSRLIGQTMYD